MIDFSDKEKDIMVDAISSYVEGVNFTYKSYKYLGMSDELEQRLQIAQEILGKMYKDEWRK